MYQFKTFITVQYSFDNSVSDLTGLYDRDTSTA